MTARERVRQTLLFGAPDRVPLTPGHGRKSTRAAWHKQGLPQEIPAAEIYEYAYRQVGGVLPWPAQDFHLRVNHRMIPQFEEKVIERRSDSQIVQDWKGNICEIGNEYTVEHLRNAVDFVTRRWIKCPVEDWSDWEKMKERYNPDDLSRFSDDPGAEGHRATTGEGLVEISFSGPFWQLREWCGFENLCMKFYDQPKLIADMLEFWKVFVGRILDRVFEYTVPDSIHVDEDMAYKGFSMISPSMVRQHLLPVYTYWGDIIRRYGTPIYALDSDGFIGELIPIWIEAGVNVCDPMEVAAGNDLSAYREQFGREMAYRGGVDKRAMAKGGAAIEKEIDRLRSVIEDGGYIPSCDHGVPNDVSWPNFVHYTQLLAEATGWL